MCFVGTQTPDSFLYRQFLKPFLLGFGPLLLL